VQGISPRARGRVALVRHGRSAHVHAGWIDAAGFRAWREAYEAAGIVAGERVPASLERLAEEADVVLSSDAPRAIASARLLARNRRVVVSPLLRELDLHAPRLGVVRLPLLAWAFAVGGRALVLRLRRRYPSETEKERIRRAAAWLDEQAAEPSLLVAVTHASFRRQLASRLLETGWQAEPGRRSVEHWSPWLFTSVRIAGPRLASP
jgi:broad specificity phosphatase PhoE